MERKLHRSPVAHDPWAEFCDDDAQHRRQLRGYQEACALDRLGQHEEADAVLRAAGVAAETVRERRSYLRRHQA